MPGKVGWAQLSPEAKARALARKKARRLEILAGAPKGEPVADRWTSCIPVVDPDDYSHPESDVRMSA